MSVCHPTPRPPTARRLTAHASYPAVCPCSVAPRARREVPDLQRLVIRRRDHPLARRIDRTGVTLSAWPCSVAPPRPSRRPRPSARLITRPRDHPPARRIDRTAVDPACVALQRPHPRPRREVPDLQRLIIRPRDHPLARRIDRTDADQARVPLQGPHQRRIGQIRHRPHRLEIGKIKGLFQPLGFLV